MNKISASIELTCAPEGISAKWNGTKLVISNGDTPLEPIDLKGDKGDLGIQGPKGDTGSKGDRGEAGHTPVFSQTKLDGVTLIKVDGVDFASISDGIKGDKGDKGDKGTDGYTPVKGKDYFDGIKGDKGDAGHTPVFTQVKTDGVTTIKVDGVTFASIADGLQGPKGDTGERGPLGASGANGKDGTNGKDGHSPVITTVRSGISTIVKVDGVLVATINDGAQGAKGDTGPKGDTGAKGADGHSPSVTASKSGNTTTIKVDGTTIATVYDGTKGDKGDTGATGASGHSPSVTASKSGTVTTIKVDGSTIATVYDGAKGDTGPKGDTGSTGATGATGPLGPQGPKGDTGASGKNAVIDVNNHTLKDDAGHSVVIPYLSSGTINFGGTTTITPLTQHQSLAHLQPKITDANGKIPTSLLVGASSVTVDNTTQTIMDSMRYLTLYLGKPLGTDGATLRFDEDTALAITRYRTDIGISNLAPVSLILGTINCHTGRIELNSNALTIGGNNVIVEGDSRLSNARAANGGNSDSVDGKHASDFVPKKGTGSSSSGTDSYAIGSNCIAGYNYAFASGLRAQATDEGAHALGYAEISTSRIVASSCGAHAEGYAYDSYIEANGNGAHAEGYADGNYISASNGGAHAEGFAQSGYIEAAGCGSHAEGYADSHYIKADADGCHVEGYSSGDRIYSDSYGGHAEGYASRYEIYAYGAGSHAEGMAQNGQIQAKGAGSHAEGYGANYANGTGSHAEGFYTGVNGDYAHAQNVGTIAHSFASTAIGRYNSAPSTVSQTSYNVSALCFAIGNGSSDSARSNAFRVSWNSIVYARTMSNTGADYAEYFEWEDGNPYSEDRIGKFVSLTVNGKIKLAQPGEDVIGVISGISSIIGNSAEDTWDKMYMRDVYGRLLYEDVEVERDTDRFIQDTNEDGTPKFTYRKKIVHVNSEDVEIIDDLDNPIPVWKKDENGRILCEKETVIEKRQKLNPDYDPNLEYIPRSLRNEWDVVGLLGQMIVNDDGSCIVGKKCSVNSDSIATFGVDYRVIKRIDDNHIMILANFL